MRFEINRKSDVAGFVLLVTAVAVVVQTTMVWALLAPVATGQPVMYKALLSISILQPLLITPPVAFLVFQLMRNMSQTVDRLNDHLKFDQLTSVFNRSHFLDVMRASRADGTLLIIDADHFKLINDSFGHDAGDDALKMLANVLARTVGEAGHVGRLGGEEFAVFLPRFDAAAGAAMADMLCSNVRAKAYLADGSERFLTISIGGVAHGENTPIGHSLKVADERLYQAKRAGRDRYVGEVPTPKRSRGRLKQVS
jgi:diguanylate cyclase